MAKEKREDAPQTDIDSTKSESKYQQIRKYILSLIDSGRVGVGQKLPTEAQLVKKFDVSRPTVAKALSDLVVSGILVRRAGAGSFVCEKAVPKKTMIGLLIPGLGDTHFFDPLCSEIACLCPDYNFHLIWGDILLPGENYSEKSIAVCQKYIDDNVTGVFWVPLEFTPQMNAVNQKVAQMLTAAGIAVILLDRDYLDYPQRSHFDLVGIDNIRAGFLQTEHLTRHGVKRIVYCASSLSASTIFQRSLGFQAAKNAAGLESNGQDIFFGSLEDHSLMDTILATHPEAIVCGHDMTAGMVLRELLNRGIRVPEDIRVMGMDDARFSSFFPVTLSTLHQPCKAIASEAVMAMEHRINNREAPVRDILLGCTMKVRESCGCAKK